MPENEETGAAEPPQPMSEEDSAAIGEAAASQFGVGESEDDEPAEEAEWGVDPPDPHGTYQEPTEPEDDYDDQSWTEPEAEASAEDEAAYDYEPEGELSEADRALLSERKARLKAERSLEWLQSEELARRRQHWVKSSAKHRPYLQPEDLEQVAKSTTSRREFERRSRALNEQVGKVAAPIIEKQMAEERAKLRAEAARAWGKPTSGPSTPAESQKIQGELERARSEGSLEDAIAAQMRGLFGKLD